MKTQAISEQNLKNLDRIREIIRVEEERDVTVDQVLRRVLEHYRKHVPYN